MASNVIWLKHSGAQEKVKINKNLINKWKNPVAVVSIAQVDSISALTAIINVICI